MPRFLFTAHSGDRWDGLAGPPLSGTCAGLLITPFRLRTLSDPRWPQESLAVAPTARVRPPPRAAKFTALRRGGCAPAGKTCDPVVP